MRRWSLVVLLGLVVTALALVVARSAGADPNDPFWPNEWGPRLTRASDLWQLTTGNPSIVIAVVDTGLSPVPVPDMTQVIPGWDIVGNDSNTTDTFGHGTWVSSIIGALGDNKAGMAGYCWHCSIMPVRVAAGHDGAVAGNIAAGIRWAVDHGARIINVSLVSNVADENELGAIEYAQEKGVLVVASAGNGGNTLPLYPAAFGSSWSNVLSVAGTDENDQLYSWSTRGSWVELSAPGCNELLDPWIGPAWACGSSFGPPAVSGIAGLLLSLDPGLTVNQLTNALRATAVPVNGIGGGRVDAWAAAHYLGLAPASPPAETTGSTTTTSTTTTTTTSTTPTEASPEVSVTTGTVRHGETFRLELDPGRLEVQLTGQAARNCSLTMRMSGQVYVDLPGETTVRTLAATVTKRGGYNVVMRCSTPNRKSYSFTATGMFQS